MVHAIIRGRGLTGPAPQGLLEREKALLHRVRLRDAEGAAAVLADLLADLRLAPAQARARVLELLVLVSRAVLEAGGDEQAVLAASAIHAEEVTAARDVEEVFAVAGRALRGFMAMLRPVASAERRKLLQRVIAFLQENYHRQHLSLEQIARVAHLSPAYLSHVFSQELNQTISEYLAGLRLEAARKLLRETDIPLADLARHVGYVNAGSFAKAFKKSLNISPGAYRQQFRARGSRGEGRRQVACKKPLHLYTR